MNERSEGAFPDKVLGMQQSTSLKDYYLTKSQVVRRFRNRKLIEEDEENLLNGLLCEMGEVSQILDYLKLPWMKLADTFFQGYIDSPLFGKHERLLASRFIELMVTLSRETSFIEKWMGYHVAQINEIKELQAVCKIKQVYSITVGDELLYNLSLRQLVEIHDTIETFLKHEDLSFQEFEDDDLYSVDMAMSVYRSADSDSYSVFYDMDTYEGEMRFTSSEQIRYVIKQMQQFLDKVEEGSSVDRVEEFSEEIPVVIKEDYTSRKQVLREIPVVGRHVSQSDDGMLVMDFNIWANELYLNGLSVQKLRSIARELEDFLDRVNEKWREFGLQ